MIRVVGLFVTGFLGGSLVASGLVVASVYAYHQGAELIWSRIREARGPREVVHEPQAGPRPVPVPPAGPLSGLVVYLSAGHGVLLHRQHHDGDPIAWGTQRSPRYGLLEDTWTARFVAEDLAPALEEAGAVVIALRERDRNPQAWVVDDSSPEGFSTFGFEGLRRGDLAVNGHDVRLPAGGSAYWRATVPVDGQYFVYTQWTAAADQDDRAIYTVIVGNDVREHVVDQREHGGHWWPLGDFCVPAGTEIEVVLTGSGEAPLSADAVRVGGGSYGIVLPWNHAYTQKLYADVAMPHQLERLGSPSWLETYECGNPVSDMRLRPHWVNWAAPIDEDALYLSIHTNAAPYGRAKGLTGFFGVESSPYTPADPESVRLTDVLVEHLWASVHANDAGYVNRGVRAGDYSEVSPVHNTLPSALLEMGFHTDPDDARRMLTSRFRRDAASGIVSGLIEWYGYSAERQGRVRTPADQSPSAMWAKYE
jgi:N-acetylmuramoyl-L-alanine amidase